MKWFERTILSIKRRKRESLILFLILFVTGLVISSAIILSEIGNTIKYSIIQKSGAEVIAYENDLNKSNQKFHNPLHYKKIEDYYRILNELGGNENVLYYDSALYLQITSNSLIMENNPTINDMNVYLAGIHNLELIDILNGKIKLTKGNVFNRESKDSFEIIIHEDYVLRDGSNIEIGSQIPFVLGDTNNNKVIYAKVIGKYKDSENELTCTFENCYNQPFYMSISSLIEIIKEQYGLIKEKNTLNVFIDEAYFKLNNVTKIEEFESLVKNRLKAIDEDFEIDSSMSMYKKIGGSIEEIKNLSSKIMFFSILLGSIILVLVSFIFYKERINEIGIYLSLGEKKAKIILQFICEILLIGIISITLSTSIIGGLGKNISETVLNKVDIELREETIEEEAIYDLTIIYKGYLSSMITILFSSIVPVIFVLKLKPKNILSLE